MKLRRIIIKIRDEKEIEILRRLKEENLPKAFRNIVYSVIKEIIIAFTKKQTDKIILIIVILEERETLEEIQKQARFIFSSVVVVRQTFPIKAYGVRIGTIYNINEDQIAEIIRKENKIYYPNLEVVKVQQPKAAFKLEEKGYLKKYSSIIIKLITPKEVNRVRQKDLISEETLLLYERQKRNYDIR